MRQGLLFSITVLTVFCAPALATGGDMGVGTEPLMDGSAAYPYLIEDLTDSNTFAGQIEAWGRDTFDECDVPAGDDFAAVAGGLVHGIALRTDGSIVQWGSSSACMQCNDVPEGNDFKAIAATKSHNLALKYDGSIAAWGCNDDGQCDVPPGSYKAIATGYYHSLAIKSDGTLAAWGYNDHGQCNVPSGHYVAVAAGFGQSLAIKTDGSLAAWGSDHFDLDIVPAGHDFIAIACGFLHNLALRSNGTLVAWGYNSSGQCNVPAGHDFIAISSNNSYCLALRANGTLEAWGYNSSGNCDIPSGGDYTAIAAGYATGFAITSAPAQLVGIQIIGPGQIGENYHGQYKAVARYNDGSTRNATDSAVWSVEPVATASIDMHGMVYTKSVDFSEPVTIYAQYTEGGIQVQADKNIEVYPSETIHVPADSVNIQAAINAARDTDTVIVSDGLYYGEGNYNISFGGKAITVQSENGPDNCVIDCQHLGRAFTFDSDETEDSVLCGFTIENGLALNGAGISCFEAGPLISNCIIRHNSVVKGNGDTTGWGGGLYCYQAKPVIINCVLSDNSTVYSGGAIYIYSNYTVPEIINCTIVSNSASKGGAIWCYGNCLISNCIIWDNVPQQITGDSFEGSVLYSDIQGGWLGAGNIDTDPLFVDPDNSVFRLRSDSFCINAGDPNYLPDPDEMDLGGNSRLIGPAVDMGAYEFPNTPPVSEAGDDQAVYAFVDGYAIVRLDGTGSTDADGDGLEYFWYDGNDLIATGAEPNVVLAVGEHVIDLIVHDGVEDSEPNSCVVTVVEALEGRTAMLPRSLNRNRHGRYVIGWLMLPEGVSASDVDRDVPLLMLAGDAEIAAQWQYVLPGRRRGGRGSIIAFFDADALLDAVDNNPLPPSVYSPLAGGELEVTLAGGLVSGQVIYGTDEIRIFEARRRRPWWERHRR